MNYIRIEAGTNENVENLVYEIKKDKVALVAFNKEKKELSVLSTSNGKYDCRPEDSTSERYEEIVRSFNPDEFFAFGNEKAFLFFIRRDFIVSAVAGTYEKVRSGFIVDAYNNQYPLGPVDEEKFELLKQSI